MHPVFIGIIGVIFTLLIVIAQLYIYQPRQIYRNLLLSIAILGIIWYVLTYLLVYSRHMIYYPFLFNKGLPFYYLIAPAMYLYVKGALHNEFGKFRTKCLLHLLIAIPGLVSIIPYNLASKEEQLQVLERLMLQPSYAFSESPLIVHPLHWIAFPLTAVIYSIFQFRLIIRARKVTSLARKTILWLYVLTIVLGIFFFLMFILGILVANNLEDTTKILTRGKLVVFMCLCIVVLSFLFFANQEFIHGLEKKVMEVRNGPVKMVIPDSVKVINQENLRVKLMPEQKSGEKTVNSFLCENPVKASEVAFANSVKVIEESLIHKVDDLLINQKVFRHSGLTLSEFASLCEIPNHKLTELFNGHYKHGFKNTINMLRVEYVKQRLQEGDYKIFTLEAIATDAGFLTRNTFFIAFKKNTGMTPSTYITSIKNISLESNSIISG